MYYPLATLHGFAVGIVSGSWSCFFVTKLLILHQPLLLLLCSAAHLYLHREHRWVYFCFYKNQTTVEWRPILFLTNPFWYKDILQHAGYVSLDLRLAVPPMESPVHA